jgi:uncharacterized membrane protein
MFASFASAASITVSNVIAPTSINHDEGSFTITFDLTNTGAAATTLDWDYTASKDATIEFSQDTLEDGSTTEITESITATVSFDAYKNGNIEIDISGDASGSGGTFELDTITIEILDSPSLEIELTQELTKNQNGIIKVTNTGNINLEDITWETVSGSDDFTINALEDITLLIPGPENSQTIEVSSTDTNTLTFAEDNIITLKAVSGDVNSNIEKLKVPVLFCEDCGNEGDLDIEILEFSVKEGFGDDEDYWYPFDEIEVEVEVKNNGDWEIEDIELEICLLDVKEGTCVMDEDDMSIDFDKFDLEESGEDDEKTIIISFKVDADDLEGGNDDYKFYVKAIGTIDDSDSDYDEDETCASDSKEIEIRTDENFIILNDFEFPEIVQCGTEVTILADIWNIGDNKIDEDDIFIRIYSKDLKIDKLINVDDISSFDREKLELTIKIPEQAIEGYYKIEFIVYDDEDYSNNDVYENSEEDQAIYVIDIKVEGGCVYEPEVIVTASLESEAKAGQELIVKTTLTNTGEDVATYNIVLTGFEAWATVTSIEPNTVVLGAGESTEILITLNVNKDVSGDKLFNVEVLNEQGSAKKQPVSITIDESLKGLSFLTGNVISEGNWYLWGIGALNIILVIIIILVALKVAKK